MPVTAEVKRASGSNDFLGTGRRKCSVARVRLRPGEGRITINDRTLDEFFCNEQDRRNVLAPLVRAAMLASGPGGD